MILDDEFTGIDLFLLFLKAVFILFSERQAPRGTCRVPNLTQDDPWKAVQKLFEMLLQAFVRESNRLPSSGN